MTFAAAFKFFSKYINLPLNYLGFGVGTQVNTAGPDSDQVPNPLYMDGYYKGSDGGWYGKYDAQPAGEMKTFDLEFRLQEFRRQVDADIARDVAEWQAPTLPVADECSRKYIESETLPPARDPLILDLDGDGIEAAAVRRAGRPAAGESDGAVAPSGTRTYTEFA